MTRKTLLTSAAVVAVLAGAPLIVYAGSQAGADKTTSTSIQETAETTASAFDTARWSQDGLSAMRSVSAAREAINDGEYAVAQDLLATAKTAIDDAAKNRPSVTVKSEVDVGGKAVEKAAENVRSDRIPIYGQYIVSEYVAPNSEKSAHINKAHEHLKKGETEAAMKELRIAEVGVSLQEINMPLAETRDHVDAAIQMLQSKKYHEANMALKAAEDGLEISTVSVVSPVQPSSSSAEPTAQNG